MHLHVASLLLSFLLWSSFAPASAQPLSFLAALPDMPLPPMLEEDPEARVIFDTVKGRVLSAAATGPGDPDSIVMFYQQSLPSLGWQPTPPQEATLSFVRDTEHLTLFVHQMPSAEIVVTFHLTPRT